MNITLIHNAGAGRGKNAGPAVLGPILRAAGHEVRMQAYGEEGWEKALVGVDAVAVAGGDGTVGRVAKQLAGRGIPLAPLPAGTANNISRALGLTGRPYEELVQGWADARRVKLDIGEVQGPWGKRYVVEGLGAGLFPRVIRPADHSATMADLDRPDAKVAYTLQMLKERIEDTPAIRVEATLDGVDVSGEYILFEAMIMPFVGPNLFLAPDCKPGDGQFELVMATVDERARLAQYLARWQEEKQRVPVLPSRHGKRLNLRWSGYEIHIDDELWPKEGERPPPGPIDLGLTGIAVDFLVTAPKKLKGGIKPVA